MAVAQITDIFHDNPESGLDRAGLLLAQVQPVGPDMTCEALHEFFMKKNTQVQTLPVVKDGLPLGVVTRYDVVAKFSQLYFRELHAKSSITELMNPRPLMVERNVSLDELSQLLAHEGGQALAEGFIITEQGRYLGLGTGQALLKELTDRKQALLAAALERATAKLMQAQASLLEKERMQHELALAREIQAGLLPRQTPSLPGYRLLTHYQSAMEVGGDYFDFLPLPNGLLGLVVADVSGKGVPGSLGMAMARSVLRTQVMLQRRPSETLRNANEALLGDLKNGMFITALYGVLHPTAHKVLLASAGHHPALHVSPRSGAARVGPQGMALGLGPQSLYFAGEAEVTLEPGEMLVLYTDGVSEALDPDHQEYGEDRFMQSLARHAGGSPDRLVANLVEDIRTFTQGAPQSDDTTIVVLRRDAR